MTWARILAATWRKKSCQFGTMKTWLERHQVVWVDLRVATLSLAKIRPLNCKPSHRQLEWLECRPTCKWLNKQTILNDIKLIYVQVSVISVKYFTILSKGIVLDSHYSWHQ